VDARSASRPFSSARPAVGRRSMLLAAGLTTNMIANMGKGKNISMETLLRICETLHCGISDVIELEQNNKPSEE
jgi:putative transcriptional regulator